MTPGRYDFTVVRGSAGETAGLQFRLKTTDSGGDLETIPFEDVRISFAVKGATILRLSVLDTDGTFTVYDPTEAEIHWSPTAEQTRLIPLGEKTYYEVEVRWYGDENVYLSGMITGTGGANDDE